MNLRSSFRLQRASNILGKVRDVATALSFAGGRLTPLSALGIAAHLAAFFVGLASQDLGELVAKWPKLTQANELHQVMREALLPTVRRSVDDWLQCEVDGQGVLVHMGADWAGGAFYVERDPEAVLAWLRDRIWEQHGARASLVPVGRWGDSVAVRPTAPAPALDSTVAREAWARIRPMVVAGETRSLLLDGKPRTGKSTLARQLLVLAEQDLGRPLRVLRISVSDFAYLAPSVVESAVALLRPDALVLDDIDRFAGVDQLLDMFEAVRTTTRLIITTCNNAAKLPQALRLPGRIDEVMVITGAGAELAAQVMGPLWAGLRDHQRSVVMGWPVKIVDELRIRLQNLGTTADAEVQDLQRRLDAAEPKAAS